MNIYLIGYRCTGKSFVGRLLAQKIGWTFVDADDEIVRVTGQRIKAMVDRHGWSAFRENERRITGRLCCQKGLVVATGGGAVIDKRNVDAMKRSGKLVWLKSHSETVRQRMRTDRRSDDFRPSLTGKGLLAEIEAVLAEREPLYQAAADVSIATDELTVEQVCRTIIDRLHIVKQGN